jgi:hypothetical protein
MPVGIFTKQVLIPMQILADHALRKSKHGAYPLFSALRNSERTEIEGTTKSSSSGSGRGSDCGPESKGADTA